MLASWSQLALVLLHGQDNQSHAGAMLAQRGAQPKASIPQLGATELCTLCMSVHTSKFELGVGHQHSCPALDFAMSKRSSTLPRLLIGFAAVVSGFASNQQRTSVF